MEYKVYLWLLKEFTVIIVAEKDIPARVLLYSGTRLVASVGEVWSEMP